MGLFSGAWLACALPLRCATCSGEVRWGPHAPALCADCGAELGVAAPRTARVGAVDVVAPFRFDGVPRQALHELKFRGNTPLARPLGQALGRALFDLPAGEHLLVPVPLHWRRRWERGHDQAAGIARVAARTRPGFGLCAALWRRRATTPQVGLGREARARNLAAAFAVKSRWRQAIEGKRAVVVDDVATTGATLAAAREALLRVGVAEVVLAAVAVAEPRSVALAGELGDDVPAQ